MPDFNNFADKGNSRFCRGRYCHQSVLTMPACVDFIPAEITENSRKMI
jgi:hypothetical protein